MKDQVTFNTAMHLLLARTHELVEFYNPVTFGSRFTLAPVKFDPDADFRPQWIDLTEPTFRRIERALNRFSLPIVYRHADKWHAVTYIAR